MPCARCWCRGGLDESKVLRVVGMGSAVLYDPKNPDSPLNRRVSIVVLSQEAAAKIVRNQEAERSVASAAAAAQTISAAVH